MFTAYFYARRIQEMEKEKQAAETRAATAEKKLQILKAQLEQANAPRRRNRRRSLR